MIWREPRFMGLDTFCELSWFLSFSSALHRPSHYSRKEGQKQKKGDGYTRGLKSPLEERWWTYCTLVLILVYDHGNRSVWLNFLFAYNPNNECALLLQFSSFVASMGSEQQQRIWDMVCLSGNWCNMWIHDDWMISVYMRASMIKEKSSIKHKLFH